MRRNAESQTKVGVGEDSLLWHVASLDINRLNPKI
jgi:hypothetical protein